MTLSHALVTLNQTAQILTIPQQNEIDYAGPLQIIVQNLDQSKHILLGSSSVTISSYGFRVEPSTYLQITLNPSDELYAIADVGTLSCGIIRVQH